MKYIFICFLICCSSCELVRIGSGSSGLVNPTQETSIGTVYLLKAELDSGNIIGASELLIHPNGKQMKAKERYEQFATLEKLGYAIQKKDIAYSQTDTLSASKHSITCSFNYLNTCTFTLLKANDSWFISDIKE
ncbi:hypothetical protein EBV26_06905 [bacterium]|nr:hypothetical protein [bacterium]